MKLLRNVLWNITLISLCLLSMYQLQAETEEHTAPIIHQQPVIHHEEEPVTHAQSLSTQHNEKPTTGLSFSPNIHKTTSGLTAAKKEEFIPSKISSQPSIKPTSTHHTSEELAQASLEHTSTPHISEALHLQTKTVAQPLLKKQPSEEFTNKLITPSHKTLEPENSLETQTLQKKLLKQKQKNDFLQEQLALSHKAAPQIKVETQTKETEVKQAEVKPAEKKGLAKILSSPAAAPALLLGLGLISALIAGPIEGEKMFKNGLNEGIKDFAKTGDPTSALNAASNALLASSSSQIPGDSSSPAAEPVQAQEPSTADTPDNGNDDEGAFVTAPDELPMPEDTKFVTNEMQTPEMALQATTALQSAEQAQLKVEALAQAQTEKAKDLLVAAANAAQVAATDSSAQAQAAADETAQAAKTALKEKLELDALQKLTQQALVLVQKLS